MSVLWVILNDDKSQVVEVLETKDTDSLRHEDKFLQHKAGNVFCRKPETLIRFNHPTIDRHKWYVNYFYWEDVSRWGYGEPEGIAWSACLALPEAIKMLEIFAE